MAVRFDVDDSAGQVQPEVDTSNSEGVVGAAWSLGQHPGRQRLTLVVIDRPMVGTTVAGRYKLVRIIGRGGMGTVFETVTPEGTRYALKMIRPTEGAMPGPPPTAVTPVTTW